MYNFVFYHFAVKILKFFVLINFHLIKKILNFFLPNKKLLYPEKYKFLRVFLIKTCLDLQSFIINRINYKLNLFFDVKNNCHYVLADGIFLDISETNRHLKLNHRHKINNEGKFFSRFLNNKKKITFFDIGSNIGEISIYIAKNFKFSKVISLEGSRTLAKVQKRNIIINKVKNVRLINKIISDTCKKKFISKNLSTENYVMESSEIKNNNIKNFELNSCITLKKLVSDNKIKKIDFLKIDIEGSIPDLTDDLIYLWNKKKIIYCFISFEKNTFKSYYKIISELSKSAQIFKIDTNNDRIKKITYNYLEKYLKKVLPQNYQGNRFQGLEVLFKLKK